MSRARDNVVTIDPATEINRIFAVIRQLFSVTKAEILSKNRYKHIAHARHLAAYFLRAVLQLSYPAIGRILGNRDHTTAMHSVKRISRMIEYDTCVQREVAEIATLLAHNALQLQTLPGHARCVLHVTHCSTPPTALLQRIQT
ncbi:hypothetical protein GF380_02285 [Candidatus Uhrbacteria bacterium]|nr:hypothetical protein [Candidatus Uhrbacteria bacterium]MBD3284045.1 hypothetical protein [Candidatus Uhrbacteria bacterium]